MNEIVEQRKVKSQNIAKECLLLTKLLSLSYLSIYSNEVNVNNTIIMLTRKLYLSQCLNIMVLVINNEKRG